MKKLPKLIVAAIVSALFSGVLMADSEVQKKSMEFSINPLQLLNGKLPLTFRVALTQKMALSLYFQGRFYSYGRSPLHGFGGGAGLKFYLNGEAIADSWYLEPSIAADDNRPTGGSSFWGITPTLMAGHTWVWTSGFVINLGIGASYSHNFIASNYWDSHTAYGIQGLMATGEFSIGYAW